MAYRVVALTLVALALVFFVGVAAAEDKADKDKADLTTHEGKVVSVTGNKLIMSADGKEHTHMVAENAKITCDGKNCKLADLKPGLRIRVSTPKDDKEKAVRVEALDKEKDFPK